MEKSEIIYFVSDFHLGIDTNISSKLREQKIVKFLESIRHEATTIYLVGDVFDHWFEYKRAIPKGFSRLFGALANLKDSGINIEFFTGNHDMWMFRYFSDEFDIPIHRSPLIIEHAGKKIMLGHGDGLGPGDKGYKFIKRIFSSRILQKLFGMIHPNIGLRIMQLFSKRSRDKNNEPKEFLGPEKEWLIQYCNQKLENEYFDYFIFGHRHLPIDHQLINKKSRYINLGDWMYHFSYARLTKKGIELLFFENEKGKIYS